MHIIYWNIFQNANALASEIKELAAKADILIIAELCPAKEKAKTQAYLDKIAADTQLSYLPSSAPVNDAWIHLFYRNKKRSAFSVSFVDKYDALTSPRDLSSVPEPTDSEYFARYLNRFERMLFFHVKTAKGEFLLVPIHFPSRMYCSVMKQRDIGVLFKAYIESMEKQKGLPSLVVGDFNMTPFELGMVHHQSFHAMPAQELTIDHNFYNIPSKTFYNPCWTKMGDFQMNGNRLSRRPAGSYFNDKATDIEYYWYVFDQVIFRAELIPKFDFKSFNYLIGYLKGNQLVHGDYSPDKKFSDHLPLSFSLNI